jgi:F1F0 ATPase subunit 2
MPGTGWLSRRTAMIKGLEFGLAALSGLLLGGMFFGGLWWTIRRGTLSRAPALWFSGSLLIRTTAALGGFYVVSQGEWLRLPACLLGFLLARFVIIRKTRTPAGPSRRSTVEAAS